MPQETSRTLQILTPQYIRNLIYDKWPFSQLKMTLKSILVKDELFLAGMSALSQLSSEKNQLFHVIEYKLSNLSENQFSETEGK